jgi:hypothetical protein
VETNKRALKLSRAVDAMLERAGGSLLVFEKRMESLAEEGIVLTGFSVRLPSEDKPDVFVVIRAATDTAKLVGFHGAPTLIEAIPGALERLYNRSIKWREDNYE